jgi:hypothetical protein
LAAPETSAGQVFRPALGSAEGALACTDFIENIFQIWPASQPESGLVGNLNKSRLEIGQAVQSVRRREKFFMRRGRGFPNSAGNLLAFASHDRYK